MPYRRLPNTDVARLRALRTAYTIGKELPPFKLAFSQSTLQKIQSFLPSFEKILLECKHAYTRSDKERNAGCIRRSGVKRACILHANSNINADIVITMKFFMFTPSICN